MVSRGYRYLSPRAGNVVGEDGPIGTSRFRVEWHRGVTRYSSPNRRRRHGVLVFPTSLPYSAFDLFLESIWDRSAPAVLAVLQVPLDSILHGGFPGVGCARCHRSLRATPAIVRVRTRDLQDNGGGVTDGEVGLPQIAIREEMRMLPASMGRLESNSISPAL